MSHLFQLLVGLIPIAVPCLLAWMLFIHPHLALGLIACGLLWVGYEVGGIILDD